MAKILKWGNGRGVLLGAYATKALGLKCGDEVIVSMDTASRQIVIAPKDQSSIDPQYFVNAAITAKPKEPKKW